MATRKLGYRWRLREVMATRRAVVDDGPRTAVGGAGDRVVGDAGLPVGGADPGEVVVADVDGVVRRVGVHLGGSDRSGRRAGRGAASQDGERFPACGGRGAAVASEAGPDRRSNTQRSGGSTTCTGRCRRRGGVPSWVRWRNARTSPIGRGLCGNTPNTPRRRLRCASSPGTSWHTHHTARRAPTLRTTGMPGARRGVATARRCGRNALETRRRRPRRGSHDPRRHPIPRPDAARPLAAVDAPRALWCDV